MLGVIRAGLVTPEQLEEIREACWSAMWDLKRTESRLKRRAQEKRAAEQLRALGFDFPTVTTVGAGPLLCVTLAGGRRPHALTLGLWTVCSRAFGRRAITAGDRVAPLDQQWLLCGSCHKKRQKLSGFPLRLPEADS